MKYEDRRRRALRRLAAQKHLLGLVLSLILLAAVAIVSIADSNEYTAASNATRNTREATRELDQLLTAIRKAESSQRGFLLTRDLQFLNQYRAEADSAASMLTRFESSNRSDPNRKDPLATAFCTATREKLDELRTTVQLARQGQIALAVVIVKTNRGKVSMDRIQEIASKIEEHQDQSLEITRTRSRRYVRWSQLTATFGSAGIFVIVLLSSIQVQKLIFMRAQLTRKLARSAKEFRILADSVPQMVWRTGESGDLNYVNEEWVRFSGSLRDSHPTAWQDLLHPQDRDRIIRQWQQARELQAPFALECRLRDKLAGKHRWFLAQAKPVPDVREGRLQWYVTFTDIDEQKATERSLLRANDQLHQFAFVAAHDLQEPLRNVHLALDLLIHEKARAAQDVADSLIKESMENARRMHTMVKDLLAYSTAIATQQTVQPSIDSEVCLVLAFANLETAIKETDARLHWTSLPQVRIEKTHLVQLFQNLIGNSLKYRKPDVTPDIQISAKRQGEEWEFSVTDNGIGFDPEYATRIFRVFKRLHRTEYEGTGIGLAICARIVAHYGGRIWAESKPQQGAAFIFTLPDHEA